MKGYNFTERLRVVLAIAREEAERLRHDRVDAEHMLLGIIQEGQCVAAATLANLKVNVVEVRQKIERALKASDNPIAGPDLPYTSRAKKVLELAMTEADDLDQNSVGTQHVLVGILREGTSVAAQALYESGVSEDTARREMLRLLGVDIPGKRTPQLPVSGVTVEIRFEDGTFRRDTFLSVSAAVAFLGHNR